MSDLNKLYLDIETIPADLNAMPKAEDLEFYVSPEEVSSRFKDPEVIARNEKSNLVKAAKESEKLYKAAYDKWAKGSLSTINSRIICISLAFDDELIGYQTEDKTDVYPKQYWIEDFINARQEQVKQQAQKIRVMDRLYKTMVKSNETARKKQYNRIERLKEKLEEYEFANGKISMQVKKLKANMAEHEELAKEINANIVRDQIKTANLELENEQQAEQIKALEALVWGFAKKYAEAGTDHIMWKDIKLDCKQRLFDAVKAELDKIGGET